jgi:hypothetical protein
VWHSKVDIENRITQPQYQVLALLVNGLTGVQHNLQPTYQDYHYGQGQANYDQQVAAPMAGNPIPQNTLGDVTPLFAPTNRRDEAITSGVDIGDGPGSIALGRLPNQEPTIKDIARSLAQYDVSGDSEMLFRMLDDAGY